MSRATAGSGAGEADPARVLALLALVRVLGLPLPGARDDSPLRALGADPVALLLWADDVQAAAGVPVDAAALAAASTFGDLVQVVSATMAREQPDAVRATGGLEEDLG